MSTVLPTPLHEPTPLRAAITAATRRPEPELIPALLEAGTLPEPMAGPVRELALRLARGVRERSRERGKAGLVQGLLQEFALSSQEGVALMCLAEALLRIPDAATRDALIRDKVAPGDWQRHLGRSPSLFVNAATWGLVVTGRLVATHSDAGLGAALRRIVGRGGEPLVRRGVDLAMRMMGEQFVTGETIDEALANAARRESEGFRHSYDMLGEAALTGQDAQRYFDAYRLAIEAIGRASAGRGVIGGPGISIKLSALHPRYARAQVERVQTELYPRLLALAQLAREHEIGLNIDAEEADRLELSLDLLERLAHDPSMAGWNGVGFVIQAYGKRCPAVCDWLIDLARRTGRRLMVRLVKGAYWDSEIKRAQLDGLPDYPVYTRKAHTDLAYLACARRLLAAPAEIYPQFATHNAQSLAAIHELAGGRAAPADRYEFQCLHGMGEPLYEQVVRPEADGGLGRPCRIYAPVGSHDTLLAYLVRRLLENGANSSFVHRIADPDVPLDELAEEPADTVRRQAERDGGEAGRPHPAIPVPPQLYGVERANSLSLDLADEAVLQRMHARWRDEGTARGDVTPTFGGPAGKLSNPADGADTLGRVVEAAPEDIAHALERAAAAQAAWAAQPTAERAARLEMAAALLSQRMERLVTILVREAGKTHANAVGEVREAIDFLRYDAAQLRGPLADATTTPLGPAVCISPWNFPLAIFVGQVAAALAAGNVVLAKPAEQTPWIASEAVEALHEAGVPAEALQLLPGRGETVGAALVADARVQAVLFTGSTEVARILQRTLAARLDARGQPVTLIAETGGQNALVADSSALTEQLVQDVVTSAFDSAGQRCSALRLLCIQDDAADRTIAMLRGAMAQLRVGDPRLLATDVGPVIDAEARAGIEAHVDAMRERGRHVHRSPGPAVRDGSVAGHFVAPTLIEIERVDELQREVFGPVLHVLRYGRDELPAVIEAVNATGYGLTFGVHSRIDETLVTVAQAARAGNLYVNRNVVGAVVGVQPFGGEGLSGTGPKAGGPLYLLRLLADKPADLARRAVDASGGPAEAPWRGLQLDAEEPAAVAARQALARWCREHHLDPLAARLERWHAQSPAPRWRRLQGPTGELDLYAVLPREAVLCLTDGCANEATARGAWLVQLAAVLAVGCRAVWPAAAEPLLLRLPPDVRARVVLVEAWQAPGVHIDAALHAGSAEALTELLGTLARRPGPIVGLTHHAPDAEALPLERLVLERSFSINTAAAGGNASLMAMQG